MQCHNLSLNISVETMSFEHSYNTEDYTMKKLSEQMLRMLERLAEMFPKAHYQSELDRYIANRYPQNAADVEHFTKEFEQRTMGKFI